MDEPAAVIVPREALRALVADALSAPAVAETDWQFGVESLRVIFPAAKEIIPATLPGTMLLFVFDNSADAVAFKLRYSDIIEEAVEAARAEELAVQQRIQQCQSANSANWQLIQQANAASAQAAMQASGIQNAARGGGSGGLFGWLFP